MDNVLTIIAPRTHEGISKEFAASVRRHLIALGAECDYPDWLSPNFAVDIPFDGLTTDQAQATLSQLIDNQDLDAVAMSSSNRKKKVLVADMDSTIVTSETLDELADFANLKGRIAAITERAMNGDLDFKEALRERVGLLKGLSAHTLEKTMALVELTPGAKQLVHTMAANGAYTALVSGGFEYFTSRVAKDVGFDENQGNKLEIKDGKLTGQVIDPIINRDGKLQALIRIASEKMVAMTDTLAVGDGANDLPMIQAAGLGVAFHAKPMVAGTARAQINHGDLTTLLYLQGYRDEEFVA